MMLFCLPGGFPNIFKTVAFNFPSTFNNNKNDSALRVLTWNVQGFVSLKNKSATWLKMLKVISEKNPDIVCMQEFTNIEGGRRLSVQDKMDSMGYKYYFFSNDNLREKKTGVIVMDGCGIFSKTPFTDSGRLEITGVHGRENMAYVTIQLNNKPLRIFTAHLESFSLYNDTNRLNRDIYEITYHRKRIIQYKLRDVEKVHAREVAIIRNEFSKTKIPFVYCGDMNTVPTSYTYRKMKEDMQDAFLSKGSGIGSTFYKILPTLRIDYLFADKNFNIIQCAVIRKKLSDHYPLVTDIRWK